MSDGQVVDRQGDQRPPLASTPILLGLYISALAAGALWLAIELAAPLSEPHTESLPPLLMLVGLIVAAEYLFVRFRFRGDINALNLVEAVLAPLLFAFPGHLVIATVAVAMLVANVLRGNAPEKTAFNVAQWSLSVGAAAGVFSLLGPPEGITAASLAALLLALGVVGIVNQAAFSLVLAIANREGLTALLKGIGPVVVPGWLIGWIVNSLFGMLFVLSYSAHSASVILFIVPLGVLHLAYRGYAGARSDRVRLTGLHRAAEHLSQPLDPMEAVRPFLREIAESFEASGSSMSIETSEGLSVHTYRGDTDGYSIELHEPGRRTFHTTLLHATNALRVRAAEQGEASKLLAGSGWRDCLYAPFLDQTGVRGGIAVLDQGGLEGFESGELAVLEALARETASMLAKGKLLTAIFEEQRRFSEIVQHTSDGIMTIGAHGTILSWNPAMQQITGVAPSEIIGTSEAFRRLEPRSAAGEPIDLTVWAEEALETLPEELVVTDSQGHERRLSCTYGHASGPHGPAALIVMARDVTPIQEIEELRRGLGRLAAAEAAQRSLVEQLQQAIMPTKPALEGVDMGIHYLASDPSAPTGGDLYDWQLLPNGELHLAVADVVGHGISATKDAVNVINLLRFLALSDCPFDDMISRADSLVSGQNPDLAATVAVARYDPANGRLRLASGGHPPALLISPGKGTKLLESPGGPLGWPGAGTDRIVEIYLQPDEALVMYTDGLIESTKDIGEGLDRLVEAAQANSNKQADELASTLVESALIEGIRRDDSLALVLRRTQHSVSTSGKWSVPPDIHEVPRLRSEVRDWLERHRLTDADRSEILLAISELVSNAVSAARSMVHLTVHAEDGLVVVEVEDDGYQPVDLDRVGLKLAPQDDERGRGLFVVRSLMHQVTAFSELGRTLVRAVRDTRRPVPALPQGPDYFPALATEVFDLAEDPASD